MNQQLIKIGQAAKLIGVSIDTLRRWEQTGQLIPLKTPGKTRLYSLSQLKEINPNLTKAKVKLKFPVNIPLTVSLLITPIFAIFAVLAIFLAIPSSSDFLSTKLLNTGANFKTTTLDKAQIESDFVKVDNSELNKNAKLLADETSDLVGKTDLNIKQTSFNAGDNSFNNAIDTSWTITQEDCLNAVIGRGI